MTKEDVKQFLEKNKVKLAIGAAVTGSMIAYIILKKKADPKVVKETVHRVTSKVEPMKVTLLDPEDALVKLGFRDYDHYGHFVEMMLDDPNRIPVSKLGEFGEALKSSIKGIEDDSRVWLLANIEVNE